LYQGINECYVYSQLNIHAMTAGSQFSHFMRVVAFFPKYHWVPRLANCNITILFNTQKTQTIFLILKDIL